MLIRAAIPTVTRVPWIALPMPPPFLEAGRRELCEKLKADPSAAFHDEHVDHRKQRDRANEGDEPSADGQENAEERSGLERISA